MHDVPDESSDDTTYECLECGTVITSETHPGDCPECGGDLTNRALSLE